MSAENAQAGIAAENGKPVAKPAAPAVIRRLVVAEEDSHARLLHRQIPALTISGGIHVVVMGLAIYFLSGSKEIKANVDDKIVTTVVEEPPEKKEDLTNTEVGFDADLKAATEAEREENVNVDAPAVPDENIGAVNETMEQPTQTFLPPGVGAPDQGPGALDAAKPDGLIQKGMGGGGGQFSAPGMIGRSGATKDMLLRSGGGNTETEAAVGRGLEWLAKQQKADGRWQFDGGSKDDVAATGMSLLPFLAAGETHKHGKAYQKTVASGVTWLSNKQVGSGTFTGSSGMYAHAIATMALCEAYGMTMDPAIKGKAQAALTFIVRAQAANGSWGYTEKTPGDTSIVGWQIQALKSGKLAGLNVPDETFKKAGLFLDEVSTDSGARYGYNLKGDSPTLSPVGLLCRYYMGWGPKNPSLAKGVGHLMKATPVNNVPLEMYYLYYATQVVHFFGGPDWHEKWNPEMKKLLLGLQVKAAGPNKGSWDKDSGHIGTSCGRLGTTCMCLLTLEVYYRHLPLYKRDSGGLAELEK